MGVGAALLGELAVDGRADQRMNEIDRMPGSEDLGDAKPVAELPGVILADPGQARGVPQLRGPAEHAIERASEAASAPKGASRERTERATGSVPSEASSPAASASGPIGPRRGSRSDLREQERVAAGGLAASRRELIRRPIAELCRDQRLDPRTAQWCGPQDLGRIEP